MLFFKTFNTMGKTDIYEIRKKEEREMKYEQCKQIVRHLSMVNVTLQFFHL